jgi:hypothetical protein
VYRIRLGAALVLQLQLIESAGPARLLYGVRAASGSVAREVRCGDAPGLLDRSAKRRSAHLDVASAGKLLSQFGARCLGHFVEETLHLLETPRVETRLRSAAVWTRREAPRLPEEIAVILYGVRRDGEALSQRANRAFAVAVGAQDSATQVELVR